MGSFSWMKADEETEIANIAHGLSFKCLIPKEFGGGYIKDKYQDYGDLGVRGDSSRYDMYELLAFWNYELVEKLGMELRYDGVFPKLKEVDKYTDHNRDIGIDIGCYDKQIDNLKYPLKLVSASYTGDYESLTNYSYGDPEQGSRTYRKKKRRRGWF